VAGFGVEQIQNGGRCHGNQGAKMLNSLRTADLFETDTKIDHHSKLCSLFLKFSNWSPFQNGRQYKNKKNKNKLLKIQI
jgi:hypothetical protein